MEQHSVFLATADATLRLGAAFAAQLRPPLVIYLQGDLGAGKTTFTRGLLQALGYRGNVTSPTYTLVETYELASFNVNHFDLYRLNDPHELEYIGAAEMMCAVDSINLIEWPGQGQGEIPAADIVIELQHQQQGRQVTLFAQTPAGAQCLSMINLTAKY